MSSLAWPAGQDAIRRAMRAANSKPADVEQVFVPAARSLSVLVAEDNWTNQMVIERILQRVGHRVALVDNGEAALEALEKNDFDVVLMDVNLPIMNAIEATKLYRFASIGQKRVPVVALTADATSDAWTRCQEAGMDGYATKPIEPARLLEIIFRDRLHSLRGSAAAPQRCLATVLRCGISRPLSWHAKAMHGLID
jgi:CheY-like chemotaxis protein